MGGQPDEGSVVGVGEDECVTTGGQVGQVVGGHVTTGGQVGGEGVGGHVTTGGQVGQVGQVVEGGVGGGVGGGVDGHVTTGEVSVHVVRMVGKFTVTMSGSIYNKGAYTACNVHRHMQM